jgi:hypothetical protein
MKKKTNWNELGVDLEKDMRRPNSTMRLDTISWCIAKQCQDIPEEAVVFRGPDGRIFRGHETLRSLRDAWKLDKITRRINEQV